MLYKYRFELQLTIILVMYRLRQIMSDLIFSLGVSGKTSVWSMQEAWV